MAEKISTIIIHADLDCCSCHKRIKKILCKFDCIQTKTFDYKQKTVTISGPFDPDRLMKCLCCKAGKYIKSYEIVKEKPKPEKQPDQPKKEEEVAKAPDQPKKEGKVAKAPDQPKPNPVVVPIQFVVDPTPQQIPFPFYVPVPKPIPVPVGMWPFFWNSCYDCHGHGEGPCRCPPLPEPAQQLALPPPEEKPRPASPPPTKEEPVQPGGPRPVCCKPCYEGYDDGPCWTGHWPREEELVPGRRTCCTSRYEGHGGGPCWQGQPSPPISFCYKSQYQGTDTGFRVVDQEDPRCKIM